MTECQKDTTPDKITFPEDTRSKKEAQDPKNTYQHVTRSGHLFEMCDNAEGEHITLQHRGGSMVQFQPDGKIMITSHDGMYTAVFGENRMYITGAYDIVVDGSASLKVKGDYNVTVDGDMNTTVSGNINTVAGKNHNLAVAEQSSLAADNEVRRTKTGSEYSSEGFMNLLSGGGMKIQSIASVIWAVAKTGFRVDSAAKLGLFSKSGMKLEDKSGIDLNP